MSEVKDDFKVNHLRCTPEEYDELAKRAQRRHFFTVNHHSASICRDDVVEQMPSWVDLTMTSIKTYDWAKGEIEHIKLCALLGVVRAPIPVNDLTDDEIDTVMHGGREAANKWYADGNSISVSLFVKFDDLQEKNEFEAKSNSEQVAIIRKMGGTLRCLIGGNNVQG